MPFTFKQFHVDDRHCGMPVSTDGVLLGAWAWLPEQGNVLDLGTGSGLLALMAAQRSQCSITAVELEANAAQQAQHNFAASPWSARLQLIQADVRHWHTEQTFDAIICNPPYFHSGERSQKGEHRAQARHTDTLNYQDLLLALRRLLSAEGKISLVMPVTEAELLLSSINEYGLYLIRRCEVKTTTAKPAQRVLLQLSRQNQPTEFEQLTIYQSGNEYSELFTSLTKNFYLKM